MPRSVKAEIRPELLVWARQEAGYTQQEVATKMRVKPERFLAWEQGDLKPTVKQLRKLAKIFHRPLAVFYLPKPPTTFRAMKDYRRLPGKGIGSESPDLRLEIRQARFRRDVAIDLFRELGVEPPKLTETTTLRESPEHAAQRARAKLGVALDAQLSWRKPYTALNAWRHALEAQGILVFQTQGVTLSEMRGFSISEAPLPVIAINIKDAVHGRIFTLLHEYAHLLLRRGGLCDLDEGAGKSSEARELETFCNHLSAAILVPRKALLAHASVVEHGEPEVWTDQGLHNLSRDFSVSREVILRRLLTLGRTSKRFYKEKREEFQQEYARRASQSSKGFAPPDRVALARVGRAFARLVLESYHQENITSSALAEYLDVRLKHVPKIEAAVRG